eukprot:3935261-Pleurochrysis_carterae.AAC.3
MGQPVQGAASDLGPRKQGGCNARVGTLRLAAKLHTPGDSGEADAGGCADIAQGDGKAALSAEHGPAAAPWRGSGV